MNLIISPHEQGTPEWFHDRLGKATGSKAHVILSKGRSKNSESLVRNDYMHQLALERINQKSLEIEFSNYHIERGKELEFLARMSYESYSNNFVKQIGFCYHEGKQFGCSVDGMVEDAILGEGFIEIKCPKASIHHRYLQEGEVPKEYLPQILHNKNVLTKAKFCDFISFNQDMPEKLRLFVVRYIFPDSSSVEELTEHQQYREELIKFLEETNLLELKFREAL